MGVPFKKSSGSTKYAHGFEHDGGPKMADTTNRGSTHTDSTYKGKGSASPQNGSPQESYFFPGKEKGSM